MEQMVNMLLLKLFQVTQVTQIVGDAFFRTAVQVSADFARLGEYIFLFYLVRDRLDRTIRRFLAVHGVGLCFESLVLKMRQRCKFLDAVSSEEWCTIFEITGVAVLQHWHSVALCFCTNVSRTFREGSGFSKFHSEVVSSAIRPCLRCIGRK